MGFLCDPFRVGHCTLTIVATDVRPLQGRGHCTLIAAATKV